MKTLKARRLRKGVSQRGLARRAGVAFRTVQLLESGRHDWRLSTLRKISKALGLPAPSLDRAIQRCLEREMDSVADVSERIALEGEETWPIYLFNFVDEFRRNPRPGLVVPAPDPDTPPRSLCLLAATVETLCDSVGMDLPDWCFAVGALPDPWFVSGVESLKAMALVHSPAHFRKRNLFVLDNFLERA
jgi:transcriptional regulator with XRE-family HTH domain